MDRRGWSNPNEATRILACNNQHRLKPNAKGASPFDLRTCFVRHIKWKQWSYVTKEDGEGFFHSFVNDSDKWICIALQKYLADTKSLDMDKLLEDVSPEVRPRYRKLLLEMQALGDSVFSRKPGLVREVLATPVKIGAKLLIGMLNSSETGRHENCTFFALILKMAKSDPGAVLEAVQSALYNRHAPVYYLEELEKKVARMARKTH